MSEPIDRFCQAIAGHDRAVTACARTLGLDPSAVDTDVLRVQLSRTLGQIDEMMAAQVGSLIGELLNQAEEVTGWRDGFTTNDEERPPIEALIGIAMGISRGIVVAGNK